jgi:hypothetical protein
MEEATNQKWFSVRAGSESAPLSSSVMDALNQEVDACTFIVRACSVSQFPSLTAKFPFFLLCFVVASNVYLSFFSRLRSRFLTHFFSVSSINDYII